MRLEIRRAAQRYRVRYDVFDFDVLVKNTIDECLNNLMQTLFAELVV